MAKKTVQSYQSGSLVLRSPSGVTSDFTLQVLGDIDVAAAPYGYAELNSLGKIDSSYIDGTALGNVEYQGTWDATANSPALPASPTTKGVYYVVSVSGTQFGIEFSIGDWIISNGVTWEKVDNTDSVISVAGKTGAVTLTKADVGLSNVDNTSDINKPISTAQAAALASKQPLDSDLTAIAGITGTGYLRRTGADSWVVESTAAYDPATITISGDATGSGTTSISLTLSNTGVSAGTYNSVTVDSKGRVTAATSKILRTVHTVSNTLQPNTLNILTTGDSMTLPIAGLSVGDVVHVMKLNSVSPIINRGGTSETIVTADGSFTSIVYNFRGELIFVWNGTNWEMIDRTVRYA